MTRRQAFPLYVIILLAAFAMRTLAMFDVPPGLAQDEVLNADIAERILNGNHALFFREGFGHEPLFHYIGALFQLLIGDNALAIRLPSIFIGLLLTASVIKLAQRWFGTIAAAYAGIFVALSWWPVIFGRLGLRAGLEALLLTWCALLWQRRPWLAALCLALACYTYTPAALMLAWPFAAALLIFVANKYAPQAARKSDGDVSVLGAASPKQKHPHKTVFSASGATARTAFKLGIAAALLAAPLYIYLYLNPDLLERGQQLSGSIDALRQGNFGPLLGQIGRTLGYFFISGDPRDTYGISGNPLFEPWFAIIFAVGLIQFARRWSDWRTIMLLTWLLIGLTPSMLTPHAPSSIRLIGALPPTYLLIGAQLAQLHAWLHQRQLVLDKPVFGKMALGIVTLLVLVPTLNDGFNTWSNAFIVRAEKYQATFQDIAQHLHPAAPPPVIIDSHFDPIDDDTIRRSPGAAVAVRWGQAGRGLPLPASDTRFTLYVPEYAPLDPALAVLIGATEDSIRHRSTQPPVFAVYELPTAQVAPAITLGDRFGRPSQPFLQLNNVRVVSTATDPNIILISDWTLLAQPPSPLRLFVHVTESADQPPLAQHDGLDVALSTLQPNDRFLQVHHIPRSDALHSDLQILFGAYIAASGERLIVNDDAGVTVRPMPPTIKLP